MRESLSPILVVSDAKGFLLPSIYSNVAGSPSPARNQYVDCLIDEQAVPVRNGAFHRKVRRTEFQRDASLAHFSRCL